MASVFRRKIAQRVLATIDDTVSNTKRSSDVSEVISPHIKMMRFGRNVPQLHLPWNKLQGIKPDLDEYFKPTSLVKALRNQGLPNTDGVTDISFNNSPPSSIVFTVDGKIFTKAVLMDLCVNLDVSTYKSCNFEGIAARNVVVHCSSPKLGEPLHMNHFRSIIHGNFIANICEFAGHKVTRINSIEDWGLSNALLVAGYELFGCEEQLERAPNFHLSEVRKAAHVKVKSDTEFAEKAKSYYQKMLEGDERILSTLRSLREPTLKEFRNIYKLLGIKFDEFHCDSMYCKEIADIENELLKNPEIDDQEHTSEFPHSSNTKSFSEKDIVNEQFYSPAYAAARNICAAMYKKNRFSFDEVFYVANASQKGNYIFLVDQLKAMGHDWHSAVHYIKLEDVIYAQASRNKQRLLMDKILHTAKIAVLKDINQSIAPNIEMDIDDAAGYLSTSALFVNDMTHRKNRSYSFDLMHALRITENTGISLQLCHAALTELIEKTGMKVNIDVDTTPLTHAEAISLVRHLARFDEIIYKAYYTLEPCIILQYLFTLSYLVEKAIPVLSLSLKDSRFTAVKARLLLLHASQKVLKKGLELLGIKPLERF